MSSGLQGAGRTTPLHASLSAASLLGGGSVIRGFSSRRDDRGQQGPRRAFVGSMGATAALPSRRPRSVSESAPRSAADSTLWLFPPNQYLAAIALPSLDLIECSQSAGPANQHLWRNLFMNRRPSCPGQPHRDIGREDTLTVLVALPSRTRAVSLRGVVAPPSTPRSVSLRRIAFLSHPIWLDASPKSLTIVRLVRRSHRFKEVNLEKSDGEMAAAPFRDVQEEVTV